MACEAHGGSSWVENLLTPNYGQASGLARPAHGVEMLFQSLYIDCWGTFKWVP